MREIQRLDAPICLIDGAPGWTEDFVNARKNNPAHRFTWRSDACYQALRATLLRMTAHHCAFCDGELGVTSRETVEHFRPKSEFPDLAYDWHNLFPCCDLCQSHKREDFDVALLKPDVAGYQFGHWFVANFETGALEAGPHLPPEQRARVEVTLRIYGLNTVARCKARLREFEAYQAKVTDRVLDDFNYRYFLAAGS